MYVITIVNPLARFAAIRIDTLNISRNIDTSSRRAAVSATSCRVLVVKFRAAGRTYQLKRLDMRTTKDTGS